MDQKIDNHLNGGSVEQYFGGNQTNNYYISIFQDSEREFVVTHNVNIKPISYFTGRETELQVLRQRIEEGRKSVHVSGMGGIGKTHICRKLFEEYVNQHADKRKEFFDHVGYIEYSGDMGSSLQSCLKFKQQDAPGQNQEAAWRELEYLAAGGKLLLFVDNVDKPISSDPGLQRLRSIPGVVILTSRQVSLGDEFESYRIGFLDKEQCIEIYEKIRFGGSEKKVRAEEVSDLEYVIESLAGRHTITVELLAHLARTKLWSVERLRNELEQKGFRLAFHKNGELINIQESYEMLYDLSKLTEAEQNILEAFSIFPYIPLAAETCNEWLLADAGVSENDDILRGLYQKGWLQLDDQESYALHPVFAQFICAKCKPEVEKHSRLIKACQESLKIPDIGTPLECQKFIPFGKSVVEKLNIDKELEKTELIDTLAHLLNQLGQYKEAKKLYNRLLKIRREILGEKHPDTAGVYNSLAIVYERQGEYEKAKELHKKSLKIYERVLGEDNPNTATVYNNLAKVYERQGEYEKAKELYEKGLKIYERVQGEEHPNTATSYCELGVIYVRRGEYEKAKELFQKSLMIRRKMLGESHPYTAVSYNSLAVVYMYQGEYEKAKELYEKSLKISERVLGEDNPDTADIYNNLAIVYMYQGEYEKAKELHEKSLRIREKVYGEDNPNTAIVYNNLAKVYERQGEYEKAKELYEKGLKIYERVQGEEHPDTAMNYNNLAQVYYSQGEYGKAEELNEKALGIVERVLGEEHPDTAMSYNNLVQVYYGQGEYKKAEELNEKALRIRERVLGEEHPDTAMSYNNLAQVYYGQGEYKKAEELYEKVLGIVERVLGEEHPNTAISYNNLAYVYASQGEYKKAIIYYYKAYKIVVLKLGSNHPNTQLVYENMKRVYFKRRIVIFNRDAKFRQWLEEQMKETGHN